MSKDHHPRPVGSLSARIKGAEIILRQRADHAMVEARNQPDPDGQYAASLRGKAHGYSEAVELLVRLQQGRALGFHRWTRKARAAVRADSSEAPA
jgi:hypothetical protein